MILSRVLSLFRAWKRAGELNESLKKIEAEKLQEIHDAVVSGRVDVSDLDSVSLCLETISGNLRKGTGRVKGEAK